MPRKPPPPALHRHSVGSSVMDGNGFPTALTAARHARLIEELEVGDWPAMAAIRAGCSPRSVERWVVEGSRAAAVEPYRSFAAAFVAVEAKLCGAATKVIVDHALGRNLQKKTGKPKGDPYWAERYLERRFRFLWTIDKAGKTGGVSVTEMVVAAIEQVDVERSQKARALLAKLQEELKDEARREGFQL